MMALRYIALTVLVFLTACQSPQTITPNQWTLDTTKSKVTLFVVKADSVGESFTLSAKEGGIDQQGIANINLVLGSIETGIPIRNERMRKHLFDIEKGNIANVSATIDTQALQKLGIGQSISFSNEVLLNMHNIQVELDVDFAVTRLSENRVLVNSAKPIALFAADLSMEAGLSKLQELANLPSITPVVGVSFSLIFEGD